MNDYTNIDISASSLRNNNQIGSLSSKDNMVFSSNNEFVSVSVKPTGEKFIQKSAVYSRPRTPPG